MYIHTLLPKNANMRCITCEYRETMERIKKKISTIYMLLEEINLYFLILKWKKETNSKIQLLGWQ